MSDRPDRPNPDSRTESRTADDGAERSRSVNDPRLQEVEGDDGFPGEFVDDPENIPGSGRQRHQIETSDTAISDAKTAK
jgi:hypothetical protein